MSVRNIRVNNSELGTFLVFFNFFNNNKRFFAFFIKLIRKGVGFLNRTGAEIGYCLDKKNAIK